MEKRKNSRFPKEAYIAITTVYEQLKGIKLQGSEHLPIQQATKTMFMNERTIKEIVGCMEVCNERYSEWTMNTVKMKMAEFVAGNLKLEKLKKFYYNNQRAIMKFGKVMIQCSDGELREYNDLISKLEVREESISWPKTKSEEDMESYFASKIKIN